MKPQDVKVGDRVEFKAGRGKKTGMVTGATHVLVEETMITKKGKEKKKIRRRAVDLLAKATALALIVLGLGLVGCVTTGGGTTGARVNTALERTVNRLV